MVIHEDIKAISFTGSTAVGKRIAGLCASQLKNLLLNWAEKILLSSLLIAIMIECLTPRFVLPGVIRDRSVCAGLAF
jgi:hypothetical protein